VEKVAPICGLFHLFSIHCLKYTITGWAKIRPIWSPWWDRAPYRTLMPHLLLTGKTFSSKLFFRNFQYFFLKWLFPSRKIILKLFVQLYNLVLICVNKFGIVWASCRQIWDRCYDFLNIFAKKFSEKIGVFVSKQSQILKKVDHNIGFWEKRQFFRRKLSKIAENCDHNIDPWSHWPCPNNLICFPSLLRSHARIVVIGMSSRVARWFILTPKIAIWVNFGGLRMENVGMFYN
jgi:hypothetical protein